MARYDRIRLEAFPMLTEDQISKLKSQLEQSETMHHKIMAKMTDPRFNLLEAWEQKERLDQEIGRLIRVAVSA
jgi:hypothetical protein